MAIGIVLVIVLVILGAYIAYCGIRDNKEKERIKKEEIQERQRRKEETIRVAKQAYERLKEEVIRTHKKAVKIRWGPSMRQSRRRELIAFSFYYDPVSKVSYLVINIDTQGRKALYKEEEGHYVLVKEEPDDEMTTLTLMPVVVGLTEEGPTTPFVTSAIQSFNDMNRIEPQLLNRILRFDFRCN